MKYFKLQYFFFLMCISAFAQKKPTVKKNYPIEPVSFVDVKLNDNFWAPRIKINEQVTIPIALKHCYSTGRVDNFKKAGGLMPGYFSTSFTFDDTDIYKIIEGIAYSVQNYPNPTLVKQMDSLIYYIEKAQEPDGYLYTARTASAPGKMHKWVGVKRWEKEPDLSHELYNAGHLYEAAVAHYQATGKRTLLNIAIKNADLLVKDFLVGGLKYEPGHQIVEMALVKMYHVTRKKQYLELAQYFLDLKGKGVRGDYAQSHKPVIEQDEAVGHAVRAMYMYAGMVDVAAMTGNKGYLNAIDKIWDNMASKKYYITGGIGAKGHGEAFGHNYELPNMSAYCETCAAIGNVYWNHRQFLMHGNSKYYDLIERTLYNGLISGVSLSGDRFFYPNPLESEGQHSRSEWFGCACCPSNICRFMPSIPGYVYAHKDKQLYINLFIQSQTNIQLAQNKVHVSQTSNYPWEGNITININPETSNIFDVLVRVPGWALNRPVPSDLYSYMQPTVKKVVLKLNGKLLNYSIDKNGYIKLSRKWNKGDRIGLELPMEIHRTLANEQVPTDKGKVSLERGPIVYCLEWPDNDNKVSNVVLHDHEKIIANHLPEKVKGIIGLTMMGKSVTRDSDGKIIESDKKLEAIPYYAWANRGAGEMAVWIPRNADFSKPIPPVTISSKAKVNASTKGGALSKINDGYWPSNSFDLDCPYYSLWPNKGTEEWVSYWFDQPETLSQAAVYWWDDRPWGESRLPLWWKVEFLDTNGEWKAVKNISQYSIERDVANKVQFEPVITRQIRLKFQLDKDKSAGLYELEVK
jgi:uncharacterized protein